MGMSTGLALMGYVPISCYPRFDFLLLAMNQLVNHLDKIRIMSDQQFKPKVIIRTSVGSKKPLNGGPQHTQDYTEQFKKILTEVKVVYLKSPKQIFPEFKKGIIVFLNVGLLLAEQIFSIVELCLFIEKMIASLN